MLKIVPIALIILILVLTSDEYLAFSVITSIFISINIVTFYVYRAKSVLLLAIIILITHYQILSYAQTNTEIVSELAENLWIPLCLMSIVISIYYLLLTRPKKKNSDYIAVDKIKKMDFDGFFNSKERRLEYKHDNSGLTRFEYVITFLLGILTNFAYDGLMDLTQKYLQL